MTEDQALLVFGSGLLAGLAAGCLAGWWREMTWGVAIGCLVLGACSGIAAAGLAVGRWQFISQAELVQGRLLAHARGGPRVEYIARDGEPRQVRGLGGSQSSVDTGGAVPVRYLRADPSQALVADFQNLWGGVFAFTLFGALPGAFGAFFLAVAVQDRRQRSGRSPTSLEHALLRAAAGRSPVRQGWARTLVRAGHALLAVAVASGLWSHDGMGEIGRVFLLVGGGVGLYGAAAWVRARDGWEAPAIFMVIALGFVLFGGGAMLLDLA